MLAADAGCIYYQSTSSSHAAAASVSVAVSAWMISSINCRHSVRRYTGVLLGPVVTMLDSRTIEVIRGRRTQFASVARSQTLKSANRRTSETYKWTVLDSGRRSVGRIPVPLWIEASYRASTVDLIWPTRQTANTQSKHVRCQAVQTTILCRTYVVFCWPALRMCHQQ